MLVCAAVLTAAPALAEEVDDLVGLAARQPDGMDRTEWKEKRRTAVKRLGDLGDRRAVPVLIEIVETEEFDVVAEHAIEALGKIGDDRAVPVLQRVEADPDRERYLRTLARQALAKLGAQPTAEQRPAEPSEQTPTAPLLGDAREPPQGPSFAADTIAASERLTFAAGSARLDYDTIRDAPSLSADAAATYERTLDTARRGYRWGGDAAVAAGLIDYDGDDSTSRALQLSALAFGEARFYSGGGTVYGGLAGTLGTSFTGIRVQRPGGDADTREYRIGLDVSAALVGGYGRVVDVGAALRLRRIEMVLEDNRLLGRPINPELAARIMRAWWALRGERGAHQHLVATVRLLREAGVLLGEPDASTTYQLLQVLLDGQLDHRPAGLDIQLGIAEAFLLRDDELPVDDGRVETLLARARYGKQAPGGGAELVGTAFARYRILAGDDAEAPWAAGAEAAVRRYSYGEYYDPIGALEIAGDVAVGKDFEDSNLATRIGGAVGWVWIPSRASRFRLAGHAAWESGEILLGATFEARYGLLDAGFVGGGRFASVGK